MTKHDNFQSYPPRLPLAINYFLVVQSMCNNLQLNQELRLDSTTKISMYHETRVVWRKNTFIFRSKYPAFLYIFK
jgi:hypothetical protein